MDAKLLLAFFMVEERYGEDELRRGGSTVIEPIRTILAKQNVK